MILKKTLNMQKPVSASWKKPYGKCSYGLKTVAKK